ncbi:hypothetical protein HGM15179_019509, partial [Zosterops borbonicus]
RNGAKQLGSLFQDVGMDKGIEKRTEYQPLLVTPVKCEGKGSILGPMLFNIFINYLDTGLERILSKVADDTKLGRAVDSLKGRETLQRDLDKFEGWAITNHMKINKGRCWILHLGRSNPECMDRLGNRMLESNATEKDVEVPLNGKLKMSQQFPGSQESQPCPGGNQAQHCQLIKGRDYLILLCTGAASP